MHNTFISHSTLDKPFAKELAEKLERNNVWFDMWDMDLGDVLSEKIEAGIDKAKNFLILLSKNSINSRWVQFELNMALIKYLEDKDYRLIVARIDDVDVPLRLKPFLRVDKQNTDNVINAIVESLETEKVISKSFKRQFVNRHEEITALQDRLYDKEVKIIPIIGFYGIGKLSLITEALKRIYTNPKFEEIKLSNAHFGARLSIELCSKAGLEIPPDGTSNEELAAINLTAMEQMIAQDKFVVFNRFEAILDDEGRPNNDVLQIVKYFSDKQILNDRPIIILSTRWIEFKSLNIQDFAPLRLKGLSNKHLAHIVASEVERIDPATIFNSDSLEKFCGQLHGYPLAGRLAAPLIVKYNGLEYLLQNLHVISKLKIDIAEDIISKLELRAEEIEILELLSIFENPLNPYYISNVLGMDAEMLNKFIDNIVSFNLIETNAEGLLLHPLINDFYFKLARTNSNFIQYSEKLAEIAKEELDKTDVLNRRYVYWLVVTCRLLFYCGKHNESRSLRHDLLGELRNAAIKLYERRDYSLSLEYCYDYLESIPDDRQILFTKARCLSRIGKLEEAVDQLEDLLETENHLFQRAKILYALGRTYIENSQSNKDDYLTKAEQYFLESIAVNEHPSALQSMGELLYKRGKLEEAASFIERKLKDSPTDPFALSIYADILWDSGRRSEAIDKIVEALKHQPKNPNFLFRAGRFLLYSEVPEEAYKFFRQAVEYDESYFDARLSLADICLDLDKLDEAKKQIDFLTEKVKGDKRSILDSIVASYYLKTNETEKAEQIALSLLKLNRTVQNVGLMAKIHAIKYKELFKKGLQMLASVEKKKALSLIEEGLSLEPGNERLATMKNSINSV